MESNEIPSAIHPGPDVTYAAYRRELFDDEGFQTDSIFRFAALETLTFSAELFEELRIGPERQLAEPAGPGRFAVRRTPGASVITYTFDLGAEAQRRRGAEKKKTESFCKKRE